MRAFSVITALAVAAILYALVVERDAVLAFAGADPAPIEAAAQTIEDEAPGISVVALRSKAGLVDTAVILRGQTEAAREVEVRAETSGRIVTAPLRKGSFVTEGDRLCAIDPGDRQIALAEARARLAEAEAARPEARARVAAAEAQLAEAQINQNAASRLSQDGFASQTRVASADVSVESARAAIEAAKGAVESVEARVQSAAAGLASAETELSRLEINAPFDGVLESDTAELGTLLQAGGLCATVIQLDPVKLVGFAPETAVDRIELGARAGARLASGGTAEGEVTFLSRSADPQTRTFRVEVEVPNENLAIRDGQTVEIHVQTEGRMAHLLPQSSMTLNDDGDLGVRLVGEDGRAQFAPVDILRDTVRGVYLTGLPETAEVIVVGQEYVTDGVPVQVTYQEPLQ